MEPLKQERDGIIADKQPWWEQISGVFKDCPEFEEAARLGREWRESQRMDYNDIGTDVMADKHGSA